MLVSSDINSANHNYPTNYNEAVYVAGSLPDTAPNETCTGPGGLPGVGDLPVSVAAREFEEGCDAARSICSAEPRDIRRIVGAAADHQLLPQLEPDPVRRQGRHRADGHDGLGEHRPGLGRRRPARLLRPRGVRPGNPLSGNEIRQLLTMTAEDVRPATPA